MRRVLSGVGPILLGLLAVVSPAAATGAFAATSPTYSIVNVGKYGGEPNIVSASGGRLYISTPQGGTLTYRSDNSGASWTPVSTADPASGDDCLATDQTGAVYLCNLNGSAETVPLQADVWKSTDQGGHWTRGSAVGRQATTTLCGTSCNPFGVDRDWAAASILAPNSTTDKAEVVLMYHDFYGPSQIWVHISTDGGANFGPPINVLAAPAFTPGAIAGTVVAQGYSMCNTIPAGVGIAPPGTPHAGRIFVAWIAADPAVNPSGCNLTQAQPFHTLWVAWSDDGGSTWTPQQAFDAGAFHDASTPFVAFTLDNQGNPYLGFAVNLNSNPTICQAKFALGTLQSDPSCEYDMYLVWSSNGGKTWGDGKGLIAGSASTPYRINPPSETGTHVFPAIAAGDPGNVAVAYLRTPLIEPTGPTGKFQPGGCAGDGSAHRVNLTPGYPGPCPWDLYAAQSVNLSAGPDGATWSITTVTKDKDSPMHVGDICNLGIACVTPYPSNRHLLDYIQETVDTKGCAHITYADDNTTVNGLLRAVNQTSGCLPNSGGRVCHEGDGGGDFHGDHGDGNFNFDSDGCIDGDRDGVDSTDRGDGKDFHSSRIDSISLDSLGTTETITGVGTSGGLPVSFVLVVAETTALTPGSVSLALSDGFVNTGLLKNGSITLH